MKFQITADRLRKEGWLMLLIGLTLTIAFTIIMNLHINLQDASLTTPEYVLGIFSSVSTMLIYAAPLLLVTGFVFIRLGRPEQTDKPDPEDEDQEWQPRG
jgi:hypothetical protein